MSAYFASTQEVDTFLRDRSALRAGGSRLEFARVCTDSRSLQAGDLFVALKGDNFDGHTFVAAAMKAGACGALVSRDWANGQDRSKLSGDRFALWMVDDTLLGLGDLARGHLRRLPMQRAALTGSNGKTTTKEFCAAILRAHFGETHVLATKGNLNNQVGVPLTAFGATGEHKVGLFEMGMNHTGEIAAMCRIVDPQFALITNVGPAHVGNFPDGVPGIAAAKGEIFKGLTSGGLQVLNTEDALVMAQAQRGPRLTYGRGQDVDVRLASEVVDGSGQRITLGWQGKTVTALLQVPGAHNALNACAAAALSLAMGVSLDAVGAGLGQATTAAGRLTQRESKNGALVVDDSYNANPASMKASIAVAKALAAAGNKRLVLILGDMRELGTQEVALHEDVGAAAAAAQPALLFAGGPASKALANAAIKAGLPVASVMHNDNLDTLLPGIQAAVQAGDVVLVKGSRGARMERAVAALCGNSIGTGH